MQMHFQHFRINRARLNYWTDVGAFGAGVVVFTTGLVLLTKFHMGEGTLNGKAFGINRLIWVNVHRLTALSLISAVVMHAYLHWRGIVARVIGRPRALPKRRSDLVLYFGFALEALAGLIAWLFLPGSPTLWGAIELSHLQPARHICIDLHNFSGLILLPAVVIHVRRHSGWLWHASKLSRKSLTPRCTQPIAESERNFE